MPLSRSGPPAADQEETPQRIRRAAREQFGRADFFSVSMSALARAARCSPSAVYQYYGSKQALFLTLCRELEDEDADLLARLLTSFAQRSAGLSQWVPVLCEQARQWGQVRRSLQVLALTDDPAFQQLEQMRHERTLNLSARCVRAGLAPPDPTLLQLCLLLLAEGLRRLGERAPGKSTESDDAFVLALLEGLRRLAVPR